MFRKLVITALLLTAGVAQAELKLVFDLNEVIVLPPNSENEAQRIFLTQTDKSLTLQFICDKKTSQVQLFDKIPLETIAIPEAEDNLGQSKISRSDCEKINKCAETFDFNHHGHITVSIDSETEAFSLDSLGTSCAGIN